MKEEELMIGDWASLYNGRFKVLSIMDDKVTVDTGAGSSDDAVPKVLKSIPITPQILMKNGFKAKSYYYELVLDEGRFRIQSDCYLLFIDSLWLNMGGSRIMNIQCEYVHELQHALRLCKIDKNIEL